jgi:3-phenylpropionate/cinnamic acid dioxygenase small subunit
MSNSLNPADLVDRALISDHLFKFARCVDTKDWQGYAALYAPHATLLAPGRDPVPQSAIAGIAERNLGRFVRTHHSISNIQVELDGDKATSHAYVHAVHLIPDGETTRQWVLGGYYDCEYERLRSQWYFLTLKLTYVWERGESLPPVP